MYKLLVTYIYFGSTLKGRTPLYNPTASGIAKRLFFKKVVYYIRKQMSWGTCYSGSNNIHFDFPPIMKDGRNYANWQPGGAQNEEIRRDNKIHSNWEYRRYLTENADNIAKMNQLLACDECCSCPAKYGNNNNIGNNNTPFLYKSCSDNSQPFGYENSDLKNLYLSDVQLQARMVTPVITQEQILRGGYQRAN